MKIKDILKQRGIDVPEKKDLSKHKEFPTRKEMTEQGYDYGVNDTIDAFQHILEVEVGDELSLEDIQKLVDKNAQPFYEKGPFGETHTIRNLQMKPRYLNKFRYLT